MKIPKQPQAFGAFSNWVRLPFLYGGVDAQYLPKAAFVSLVSLLFSPLGVFERLRYGRPVNAINATQDHAPIFIIGHWRSGTTYLHNLFAQDTQFSYVTTWQTVAPGFSLSSRAWLPYLLRSQIPKRRMMDEMLMDFSFPQEEEIAVGSLCPYSFSHALYFPRKMPELFDQWGLFEGVSPGEFERWKRVYEGVIKKAMYNMGGRTAVVKNPVNTARMPALRELFPGAKFIHIYRNPYEVFVSTLRMYEKVMALTAFQEIDRETLERFTLGVYEKMYERFDHDKLNIPAQSIVDVRYEDLESDPVEQMRRIYEALNLSGFEDANAALKSYVESQASYRKNVHVIDDRVREQVETHWGFAIERWGYT